MHEKRFNRQIERLRDPDRIARLELERVVQLAMEDIKVIHTALDVGTGSGLFAEQFSLRGLAVTGLDANPEMLPAAKLFVPSGTFKEGVAEKLPFPDRSFDLVFMGLVLHETDDLLAALTEAHRVVIQRLAILEWPYEEQPFGPPVEDRLSFERIATQVKKAGFANEVRASRLENLVLYRVDG